MLRRPVDFIVTDTDRVAPLTVNVLSTFEPSLICTVPVGVNPAPVTLTFTVTFLPFFADVLAIDSDVDVAPLATVTVNGALELAEIGRASCRERVWTVV